MRTALLLGAAVPAVLAQNITIYGPDDLHADVTATFLDCLNSLSTSYRVYVDEGLTVVLPASSNRTIDFEDTDKGLYNCMTIPEVITAMQIATEDTTEDDENQDSAVHVSATTHSWLVGQGAQGQKAIGTQPACTNSTLDARDSETGDALMIKRSPDSDGGALVKRTHYNYYGYLSDYSTCTNNLLVHKYGSTCYNYSQAWYSVRFENAFSNKILTMKIWPHHHCEKGNKRTFTVYASSLSSCQSRKTYSFYGHYKSCSC